MTTELNSEILSDAAAPLDLLLTRAATGMWRRFIPSRASVTVVRELAVNPKLIGRAASTLAGEYIRIGAGRSKVAPAAGDRRFTEPAWTQNALLKAVLQSYLITSSTAQGVVDGLHLTETEEEKVRFVVDNVTDALAPTNNPLVNPLFYKALVDTGGLSAVRGVRSLVSDLATAPRVPTMVDTRSFRIGRTIAATPGAVVLRTPLFELIRYTPTTENVSDTPLVIVPPVINKYYVVDLAPGRSLVEFLVSQGHSVFAVSWRNPDTRHRSEGFDAYLTAVDHAVAAARELTGSDRAHLLSLCSGGVLSGMYAAHLAELGRGDEIATFSLAVSVLDQGGSGTVNALADPAAARKAVQSSASKGYLDGASLAEVFAWLRPNDLVWNYWVNNYIQGKRPPAFDILFWNADTTRMTAALHRDFVDLFLDNKLTRAGAATALGSPVDLSAVTADNYIVAGVSDHICPWQNCYRSTQLLGGKTRFVLSRAGHVACIVNPPSNPKSTFRVAESTPESAEAWLAEAKSEKGSWWTDYSRWLSDREHGESVAPKDLGNDNYPVLETAPGSYVFDN